MLTQGEVEDLFRDLESDRVERKATYENRKEEIRQAICAFANDLPDYRLPGVVFVGQRDDGGDGALDITDPMLLSLGGMRSDGKILPFPSMAVTRRIIDGVTVAVVIVRQSNLPSVSTAGRG